MKKTLRFIALAGIIATCWLSSEKPGHSMQYCYQLDGIPCPPHYTTRYCLTDNPGYLGTCTCTDGYLYCEY